MKVCAFVLHLRRAETRRENAQTLLDTCGLDGEIWPAVDGAKLSEADIGAVYHPRLFAPHYPFQLRHGEIGAFLSHRQIWAEILRRDLDAALILEDDVALDQSLFGPARDLGLENAARFGYIKMRHNAPGGQSSVIDRRSDVTLAQGQYPGLGATGQIVSREGAARLLERCKQFDRPVDTFVQSHWHTGLRPATVFPSGVTHIDKYLAGSTIQQQSKTVLQKLHREGARVLYRSAVHRYARHSNATDSLEMP